MKIIKMQRFEGLKPYIDYKIRIAFNFFKYRIIIEWRN